MLRSDGCRLSSKAPQTAHGDSVAFRRAPRRFNSVATFVEPGTKLRCYLRCVNAVAQLRVGSQDGLKNISKGAK